MDRNFIVACKSLPRSSPRRKTHNACWVEGTTNDAPDIAENVVRNGTVFPKARTTGSPKPTTPASSGKPSRNAHIADPQSVSGIKRNVIERPIGGLLARMEGCAFAVFIWLILTHRKNGGHGESNCMRCCVRGCSN